MLQRHEWLTQLLVTMFMWGSARNLSPALSGHYHVIKDRTLWEVQECAASPDQWPACEGVKIPDESHNTMKLIWTFCKPQECKQKLQYCEEKERRRDGQGVKKNLVTSKTKQTFTKLTNMFHFLRFYLFLENTWRNARRMLGNGESETGVKRWEDSGAGERWALHWTRASDCDTLTSHPVHSLLPHEEVTTVVGQCNVK